MIALSVALAVVVGVALGLLGGGGSILMVPLLTGVAGMDAQHAIATSLLVVGVTSAIAGIAHARAGRVRWRVAAMFGVAAMAGAFGGGLLARFVPGTALLVGFGIVMLVAGVAMLRRRPESLGSPRPRAVPRLAIIALGLAVGLISGLIGAGGGFLLVPALTLLADLPMPVAVGTSLVVIAMQSFAGFAGHLASAHVDVVSAAAITLAAVIGSFIGGWLTSRTDPAVLRALFGWFVLLMAALVLGQQTTPAVGVAVGSVTVVAAVIAWLSSRRSRSRAAVGSRG